MLLAVLGAARLARLRLPQAGTQTLVLRGTLALGPRRRLHLVEADGARALILIGGATETALLLPRPDAPP